MNISESLLEAGFKCNVKDFNPKDNWNGLSLYQSDVIFKRGEKIVGMSLQGILVIFRLSELGDQNEYKELLNSCSVKWIGFKNGDNYVYETFSGEMPTEDIFNSFLNE